MREMNEIDAQFGPGYEATQDGLWEQILDLAAMLEATTKVAADRRVALVKEIWAHGVTREAVRVLRDAIQPLTGGGFIYVSSAQRAALRHVFDATAPEMLGHAKAKGVYVADCTGPMTDAMGAGL